MLPEASGMLPGASGNIPAIPGIPGSSWRAPEQPKGVNELETKCTFCVAVGTPTCSRQHNALKKRLRKRNLHDALDFGHSGVQNPVTVANLYQNLYDALDSGCLGVQNPVTVIRQL